MQPIYPGYRFLSEDAKFASLCQKKEIIFIAPPS
ncbi:biotin carboxylase N-terminal domain-containing protein [Coxiella-like endosymbiont of Rhipicephalus sanguineus]